LGERAHDPRHTGAKTKRRNQMCVGFERFLLVEGFMPRLMIRRLLTCGTN